MAAGDLTTISHLRQWLGLPMDPAVTAQALRLITQVSRAIYSRLSRTGFIARPYTDVYDGRMTRILILRNWPVLSVQSLAIGSVAIPVGSWQANAHPGWGYMLDEWDGAPPGKMQRLTLRGAQYWTGYQNIAANYTAGYQVTGEPATIPALTPFTLAPAAPYGFWAADGGVTYAASQTALVAVASAPGPGQYVPPDPYADPEVLTYQFNAADAGAAVLLTYSYIPADIEEVCLELIGERNAYKGRIGLRSKVLASRETLTYDLSGWPPWISTVLQQYARVVPI